MYIQNQSSRNGLFLAAIACALLLCSHVAVANNADWGLVKRFNEQLSQAEKGKVSAMYEVGHMYERGRGTTKSLTNAATWYQKASDAGHDSAKARLGKMYLEGRGVQKDIGKASQLISEAARNGIPAAQYQLGVIYEIGIGRDQDTNKALFWYKKAAELGHYQAERKVTRLKNETSPPYIANTSEKPAVKTVKPASKPSTTTANTISSIAQGSWQRGKKPAGYLPSSLTNCNTVNEKTIKCVSGEQERSTGSEIITYIAESTITVTGKNNFTVEYVNNVQDVEVLQAQDASGIEGEETVTTTKTRIATGKQDKVHKLKCELNNPKSITCTKGSIRTYKFTS